jgi:hypothetical protein
MRQHDRLTPDVVILFVAQVIVGRHEDAECVGVGVGDDLLEGGTVFVVTVRHGGGWWLCLVAVA